MGQQGNYSAILTAFPQLDLAKLLNKKFVRKNYLGLNLQIPLNNTNLKSH